MSEETSIPGIIASTPPISKDSRRNVSHWLQALAVFLHSVSLTLTASWYTVLWAFLPFWPVSEHLF